MGITPKEAREMMNALNKVYAPKAEPAVATPDGVHIEPTPPETEKSDE